MDQVGEENGVLDEEDGDVVADDVYGWQSAGSTLLATGAGRTKVALVGVEASGEAVHVSRRVSTASAAGHGREAHKGGRRLPGRREERRGRDVAIVAVAGEVAVGA
jgi:hypothetical protein